VSCCSPRFRRSAGRSLSLSAWLAIAAACLLRAGNAAFARRLAFPLGALVASCSPRSPRRRVAAGPDADAAARITDLPFHLRIDALAGFFLMLLGSVSAGISIYAAGYFRAEPSDGSRSSPSSTRVPREHGLRAPRRRCLLLHVAWETMALSSYFLVITDHKQAAIRSARLSLPVDRTPRGAIAILLCFGVLHGGHGDYSFDALRARTSSRPGQRSPSCWRSSASRQSGILPLHVWLPERTPLRPRRCRR